LASELGHSPWKSRLRGVTVQDGLRRRHRNRAEYQARSMRFLLGLVEEAEEGLARSLRRRLGLPVGDPLAEVVGPAGGDGPTGQEAADLAGLRRRPVRGRGRGWAGRAGWSVVEEDLERSGGGEDDADHGGLGYPPGLVHTASPEVRAGADLTASAAEETTRAAHGRANLLFCCHRYGLDQELAHGRESKGVAPEITRPRIRARPSRKRSFVRRAPPCSTGRTWPPRRRRSSPLGSCIPARYRPGMSISLSSSAAGLP
jgi:hypothetical protein